MQLEFIIDKLPPSRTFRCPHCARRFFDGAFYGLLYELCHRCKAFVVFLDGEVIYSVAKGSEVLPAGFSFESLLSVMEKRWQQLHPQNESLTKKTFPTQEIMSLMEERWISLQQRQATQRGQVAVGRRFDVFVRDNFRCQYCGKSVSDGAVLEADHIIPRSKGGLDEMGNLITACWDCNRGKSAKPL